MICFEDKINFIITGSVCLKLFKKSGDSLAGRYFIYRLNPLLMAEIATKKINEILPEKEPIKTIKKFISHNNFNQDN